MSQKKEDGASAFLSEKELFHALTKSAFEFLNKAIDEFEESEKFSTIHFATAIELFLKAKLMREHWSLLLEKPDQADKAAFFRGNAKTVSPEQAMERLHKIAQVSIPQEFKDAFSNIAKHRNKMVHFVHADENKPVNSSGQKKIAEEQCAGWLALKTLLGQWNGFKKYKNDISHISWKMNRQRLFLKTVFESKSAEINGIINSGEQISECPSCGYAAIITENLDDNISFVQCLVCRHHGTSVTITCSNAKCGHSVVFNSNDGHPVECSACGQIIEKECIRDQLDTGAVYTKDTMMDHYDINCPSCNGYHTVVEHGEKYICIDCFDMSENCGICGYCGEGQLGGVGEHSSFTGCEFCDGAAARYADD